MSIRHHILQTQPTLSLFSQCHQNHQTVTNYSYYISGDVLMRCPSDVNSDVKLKSGNLKWDWNLENREFNFTIEWRLPTLTHT